MIPSVAKETNASSAGNNRACSNRRSGKNKCSDSEGTRTRDGVLPRRDSYAMEVNRERNCYVCGGFGHMVCYCRNQGRGRVANGRRLEYGGGRIKGNHVYENNLKEEKNLKLLN